MALSPFQAHELGDQFRQATEQPEPASRPRTQDRPKGRRAASAAAAGKLNSAATKGGTPG